MDPLNIPEYHLPLEQFSKKILEKYKEKMMIRSG